VSRRGGQGLKRETKKKIAGRPGRPPPNPLVRPGPPGTGERGPFHGRPVTIQLEKEGAYFKIGFSWRGRRRGAGGRGPAFTKGARVMSQNTSLEAFP